MGRLRFHWLVLTCLSFFFFCNPAHAGKLLFWRFDSSQNRLIFSTDRGVQPTAQLIANPTRLVIDLPGTVLGRPSVSQNLGSVVTSLRVGQFDSRTTRLVVELAPGYILDPQQIKIRGISPTQWAVELPNPERGSFPSTAPASSPSNFPAPTTPNGGSTSLPGNSNLAPARDYASSSNSQPSGGLRVTSSGIILDIEGNSSNRIKVERSRDRSEIDFELKGVTLPPNLPRKWQVNQYGIKEVEVSQNSSSPPVTTLTLNVEKDSPDWQATFSRTGNLILWPQGGMNVLQQKGFKSSNAQPQPSPTPTANSATQGGSPGRKTSIEAIEVDHNQLLIKGNQKIQAKGAWNSSNGVYEIRLENTDLSPQFRSPQLQANSPIARMRIWQPDEKTVVILAQPALGVRIAQFNQPAPQMVSLGLTRYSSRVSSPPARPFPSQNASAPININNITPVRNTWQSNNNLPPSKSKTLVIIDPGHGGKDPGAIGIGGIQEKQIVMSISQEIARALEEKGVQVKLTRGNDYFVSLQGRTDMANRIDADLFVSIHANSAGSNKPQVSGLETYYYQSGRNLAATIHRNILSRVDVGDRKVRQARFYVLRKSNMPSVLVETGFVTGREDAAKLTNPSYQKQMAQAIAAGILEYIQTRL